MREEASARPGGTLGFAVGFSAEEARLGGAAGGREPRARPGAGRRPSSGVTCRAHGARHAAAPSRPPGGQGRRALCHGRCCCGGLFAGAARPRCTRTRRHGGHAPPPLRSPCPVARGPRRPATTPPSVLALAGRGLAPGSGPAERDSAWRAGRAATPGTSYADRSGWRAPALRPAEETRVGVTVTPRTARTSPRLRVAAAVSPRRGGLDTPFDGRRLVPPPAVGPVGLCPGPRPPSPVSSPAASSPGLGGPGRGRRDGVWRVWRIVLKRPRWS